MFIQSIRSIDYNVYKSIRSIDYNVYTVNKIKGL